MAQKPVRGHEAVTEKKLQGKGEGEEDRDRKDTQKYTVNMGGEGPRIGRDKPETN